jgi:hypothetical protein
VHPKRASAWTFNCGGVRAQGEDAPPAPTLLLPPRAAHPCRSAPALLCLGRALLRLGDRDAARNVLTDLAARYPGDTNAALAALPLAHLRFEAGDAGGAVELYHRFLDDPLTAGLEGDRWAARVSVAVLLVDSGGAAAEAGLAYAQEALGGGGAVGGRGDWPPWRRLQLLNVGLLVGVGVCVGHGRSPGGHARPPPPPRVACPCVHD